MELRASLIAAALAALSVNAGCGDDSGSTPDAGPGVDSGGVDAGTADAGPMLPPLQKGDVHPGSEPEEAFLIDPATAVPADFSCMGTRTEPAEGASISFTLTVEDFQEGNPVPEVCVEFYPDNVVATGDTCEGMTTDASGNVTVMDAADSWYAYRVFPKDGPTAATTVVGSVQYNEPAPAMEGGSATGNSVSGATIELIPVVLGFNRAAGTAVIAGQVHDCVDDPVYGAHVRIYDASGNLIPEGTGNREPHYRYFDGEDFPSSEQPYSHVDGLYAIANLPVPSAGTAFFMELWGRTTADAQLELLGCEQGTLYADTVTILNIGPMRSDGPTCPSAM